MYTTVDMWEADAFTLLGCYAAYVACFYRRFGAVCRSHRTWCWKLGSRMERNLCLMQDTRHVMKVICPYQLDVAVNVCFMKSWHCNTCGCQAIEIFAYVHKHQQTDLHYTILASSLQAVSYSMFCLLHSSLHLPKYVCFLLFSPPSFLISFHLSFLLSFVHFCFLNSFFLFSILPYFSFLFLIFHSYFQLSFFLPPVIFLPSLLHKFYLLVIVFLLSFLLSFTPFMFTSFLPSFLLSFLFISFCFLPFLFFLLSFLSPLLSFSLLLSFFLPSFLPSLLLPHIIIPTSIKSNIIKHSCTYFSIPIFVSLMFIHPALSQSILK